MPFSSCLSSFKQKKNLAIMLIKTMLFGVYQLMATVVGEEKGVRFFNERKRFQNNFTFLVLIKTIISQKA